MIFCRNSGKTVKITLVRQRLFPCFCNYFVAFKGCCYGASVASEQQHKQDLKEYIEGGTNSRIHHFLPECIVFNQSALRHFLLECIAPRGIRGCHNGCHNASHTAEPSSFFAWILVVIFCSRLPVNRREEDRA